MKVNDSYFGYLYRRHMYVNLELFYQINIADIKLANIKFANLWKNISLFIPRNEHLEWESDHRG